MFVNSGMVQFKNYFTGAERASVTRATTSQKSVRAGGKHNDLDNVGYTARHHTFFEMLGNFSFGDYFKEEAISLAWRYLTEEIKLPRDKLLVTVYHSDDEAYNLWKKIANLRDAQIIRITTHDNFWSMGDKGPCGPCSEIFFDHGESVWGGPPGSPTEHGDRFIEIWNLVFMQYEQVDATTRTLLPKPSIDTGMGLERISAVIQNVHDNFDIDLFKYLIDSTADVLGVNCTNDNHHSFKIIADHLRACSFLIASGIFPGNEGRGYVLRRIMRRAMRHLHLLGAKSSSMYKLFPSLMAQMGEAYPELIQGQAMITSVLFQEEEKFKQTLDKGLKLLSGYSSNLKPQDKLPGDVAFKLYDTYGFPLDLTMDILRTGEVEVDTAGFETCMEEQRTKSRASWLGSGDKSVETIWFDVKQAAGSTEFLGYALDQIQGVVLGLVAAGKTTDHISKAGSEFALVTNQTPFYGESGGQMGDCGTISGEGGLVIKVTDTKKFFGCLHIHYCLLEQGSVKLNDAVTLAISVSHRNLLRANHSATHLLHSALRLLLGEHVTQKGSLVTADYLRFDFSHSKGLEAQEVLDIEQQVNRLIIENSRVNTIIMPTKLAMEQGAMALFGEKYDDEVRVVKMGGEDYSVELCGGTHVKRTGDIGLFKILKESAIASGIRRIEAKTGLAALLWTQSQDECVANVIEQLKVPKFDIKDRLSNLLTDKHQLEKELQKSQRKNLTEQLLSQVQMVGSMKIVTAIVQDLSAKDLRISAEDLRDKLKDSAVVVLISETEGKASTVITISNNLASKVSAVNLLELVKTELGGSGGGKDNIAQTGGGDITKAKSCLEKIMQHLTT
jgi:alanyl-tRNA synthetase